MCNIPTICIQFDTSYSEKHKHTFTLTRTQSHTAHTQRAQAERDDSIDVYSVEYGGASVLGDFSAERARRCGVRCVLFFELSLRLSPAAVTIFFAKLIHMGVKYSDSDVSSCSPLALMIILQCTYPLPLWCLIAGAACLIFEFLVRSFALLLSSCTRRCFWCGFPAYRRFLYC